MVTVIHSNSGVEFVLTSLYEVPIVNKHGSLVKLEVRNNPRKDGLGFDVEKHEVPDGFRPWSPLSSFYCIDH